VKFKREIVEDQLRRIGGIQNPPVEQTIPSPSPWNARNRMGFSLTQDGRIGLVGRDPEQMVELSECHLPCASIGEIWPKLEFESGIALERVSIRAGYQDEILIVLRGETKDEPEFAIELPVNVVLAQPDQTHVVAGEGHIYHQVGDALFQASANSFFQINTDLVPTLVEHLLTRIDPGPGMRVFDLYSGVGLFSFFLSKRGASIVAVEESPSACFDYEVNLKDQGEVELYQARVEEVLPVLTAKPDAIIVDPPRAGLKPQTVDQITRLKPEKLIYISCDPATFARDAKRFVSGGFKLEQVIPFDLFPQTYHIEVFSSWSTQ
jgi:23S rRNA (uracil1939-C5)-methyltransferase